MLTFEECRIGDKVMALPNYLYAITTDGWTGHIVKISRISSQICVSQNGREEFWVDPEYFVKVAEAPTKEAIDVSKIITPEERLFLLNEMAALLDEYDYRYDHDALNRIIDEWATSKANFIRAFKKHPNYVEGKFLIAFDADYERKIDTTESRRFSRWLDSVINEVVEYLPKKVKEQCDIWETIPYDVLRIIDNLHIFAYRFISEENAGYINDIVPEVHAHPGQKTSRVINKLLCYLGFDKVNGYNREFAKYADSLSPLKITRHTVLSINPIDYLTMSFGNSWASCHTIDKHNKRGMPNSYHGQYCSGTVSYMLDPSSMVFYTVDASYNGNEYWTQPKINRQMFHYENEKLVQARLYPQDFDGDYDAYKPYRHIVQEIISTIFDLPNLWTVRKGNDVMRENIHSDGTNYEDYFCYSNCNISFLQGSENIERVHIGHPPICIECGCEHSEENTINCCNNGEVTCAICGCIVDEDEAREIDGEWYCNDHYFYCESCNEYHAGEGTYISGGITVCDWCRDEYYTYCDDCDEWVDNDNVTWIEHMDRYVCSDCLAQDYTRCASCGEWFPDRDIYEHDERMLCESCLEECLADKEEENEAC